MFFQTPIEADNRSEFGHFEADSIEFCKIRGKVLPYLTVVVKRTESTHLLEKRFQKPH